MRSRGFKGSRPRGFKGSRPRAEKGLAVGTRERRPRA